MADTRRAGAVKCGSNGVFIESRRCVSPLTWGASRHHGRQASAHICMRVHREDMLSRAAVLHSHGSHGARTGACVLPAGASGGCGAPPAGGSSWAGEELLPLPHGPMAGEVDAADLWSYGQVAVARVQITGQGAHGAPIWLQCVSFSGIVHVHNAMSVDQVRCVLQGLAVHRVDSA